MKINPRLRLRHLRTFLEIAQSGSLGAAADRLHVTQPAVSKTLRELEEIVGQPLFDRVGRRLQINRAGATYQRRAGAALAELDSAQAELDRAPEGQVKLSVGVLPTAATGLFPRAALRFQTTHPHCVLRVSTGPNWLLLSQLRDGTLDLVVGRRADAARMAGLTFRQLYLEDIVAVARADHPERMPLGAAEFARYPLIVPPSGAVIGEMVSGYLEGIGAAQVAPAFETVSLAFGRKVVQTSDAIWIISRGVVAEELDQGMLQTLPLATPIAGGPVGLSLRDGAAPSPDLADLVTALYGAAGTPAA